MKPIQLKRQLKKNKYLDSVSRILFYPVFLLQYIKSDKEAKERESGREQDEFLWIKEKKDCYCGERCFIVATGPSLTVTDLDIIKNEYCFSMNSSILSFPKTSWRPQIYAIQDEYVYEKLEKDVFIACENGLKEIWVSQIISKKFKIPVYAKIFPLHYLDHKMFHHENYGEFRFSDDCYVCIYDAYSIIFSLMQMACYMGFKEIYLLGCDCNYNQEKTHFIEYGHSDPKASFMGDKIIQGHYWFKKFADSKGIKVINCTPGGMLEVYPRMDLKDVLGIDS